MGDVSIQQGTAPRTGSPFNTVFPSDKEREKRNALSKSSKVFILDPFLSSFLHSKVLNICNHSKVQGNLGIREGYSFSHYEEPDSN